MKSKYILIAVDASENALRAVEYTAAIVGCNPEFQVKLLYIEKCPDRDLFQDEESWKTQCALQKDQSLEFLNKAVQILKASGLPEKNIVKEFIPSCASPVSEPPPDKCWMGPGIVEKILDVIKEEQIGTVVIGRRGISKAEEFLFGSVSSKVVHYAKNCTVWVVA